MSIEHNKKLVRRYFEEAPKQPEVYDEILTDDFQVHALHHATVTTDEDRGPNAYKMLATAMQQGWADNQMVVEELIAEGDRVMARWTFRGVHVGDAFGVLATSKEITYAGINIFRIANSKLAESWDLFDRLWIWQQLGAIPPTREFLTKAREAREQ
ncbi:MAG: ester cyclase [Caldilineaceae bacterium]